MNKELMSEEAFNELIDGLEYVERLTEYGRRNIKYYVQKLQQENKILKENVENNDKTVDNINWENMLLKNELKNKPDTEITLQDDKGNKFMLIQTERIDMQEELNKTIQRLFNNWNKLKEYMSDENISDLFERGYQANDFIEEIRDMMQELEENKNE